MKKIFMLMLVSLLFTASCQNNTNQTYILGEYYHAYAYNTHTCQVEIINTDFVISNPRDVFLLYTSYQNYLPIGYSSEIYTTVDLLGFVENDTTIFYYVDDGINNVNKFDIFINVLSKTNLLLYEKETVIINNYTIVT